MSDSPWLTADSAIEYLGGGRTGTNRRKFSKRLLRRAVNDGKLRAARVGGRCQLLFRVEWLDAWLERPRALRLALRCARDSMPPLRLAILEDVAAHPGATTPEVRRRLNKPRNTVDRQLQALHMLGALACDEIADPDRNRSSWHYYVSDGVEPATLRVPDLSPHIHVNTGYVVGDISGTGVIQ